MLIGAMSDTTHLESDRPDGSTLTPLGPGGRPLARWRGLVTMLAILALVAVVAVLLSARAPGVISEVSDRVATRVDRDAPEASAAAQRALARSGVKEHDTLAHIGLWAGAMVLVGLASWSWRSLIAGASVLLVSSTTLEVFQERLSPTRVSEWSDVVANVTGLAIGLVTVLALTSVSGVPARFRRWRRG